MRDSSCMEKLVLKPQLTILPVVSTDLGFPVRRIYCVGRNYVEHIREMKEADELVDPFNFLHPAGKGFSDSLTISFSTTTRMAGATGQYLSRLNCDS